MTYTGVAYSLKSRLKKILLTKELNLVLNQVSQNIAYTSGNGKTKKMGGPKKIKYYYYPHWVRDSVFPVSVNCMHYLLIFTLFY